MKAKHLPSIFGYSVLALASGLLPSLAPTSLAQADSGAASAASWSQFRGPAHNGVSEETGLLHSWPESGPDLIWRRSIGTGFSGFAVAGDAFYTLFADGEDEFLGGFRVEDGEELWRLGVGQVFSDTFGAGPRSTPSVVDDVVYALGGRGRLVAADTATGELFWGVELYEDRYGVFEQAAAHGTTDWGLQLPTFGYAHSPLVEGDLLLVDTGHGDGQSIVAFDRWTGEPRWRALDSSIGYASPMAVTLDGQRQILVMADNEVVSLLPSGEVSWRQPWSTTFSQPVFLPPDKVFVSTINHEVGAMVFRIDGSTGKPETEVVWTSRSMKNFWSSSVAYNGYLYGFDNATLRCLSAEAGELCWAKRGLGKGSLVAADGLLILLSDQGVLTLVEASPEGYRQKGQVRIFEQARTWTPPAIAGGKLFLRGPGEIVCLDLVDSGGPAARQDQGIALARGEGDPAVRPEGSTPSP